MCVYARVCVCLFVHLGTPIWTYCQRMTNGWLKPLKIHENSLTTDWLIHVNLPNLWEHKISLNCNPEFPFARREGHDTDGATLRWALPLNWPWTWLSLYLMTSVSVLTRWSVIRVTSVNTGCLLSPRINCVFWSRMEKNRVYTCTPATWYWKLPAPSFVLELFDL